MKRLTILLLLIFYWMVLLTQTRSTGVYSDFNKLYCLDTDSLYDGHNYQYYKDLNKKALKKQNIGIALTVLGGASLIGGYAILDAQSKKCQSYMGVAVCDAGPGGLIVFTVGVVMFPIGLSMSLVWSSKKRKSKMAMEEIQNNMTISIGMLDKGIGIVLTF